MTISTVSEFGKIGVFKQAPSLWIAKTIPEGMYRQVEFAVRDFVESSKLPNVLDKEKLYADTLEEIASRTVFNNGGDLWLAADNGELVGYAMARFVKDVGLTYWISQAWVRKDYRTTPYVKEWWSVIRRRAMNCMAKHIVIVASRNPKAYKRFLGLNDYATLLREDL